MCGGYFSAHDRSWSARPFWRNCSTKCEIPKIGRDSKVTRHRMAMMTQMSEPEAAHPRPLAKLPTVHGIVNQELRYISDNQAACCSAGNLDIPKQREKKRKEEKLAMLTQIGAPMKSFGREWCIPWSSLMTATLW